MGSWSNEAGRGAPNVAQRTAPLQSASTAIDKFARCEVAKRTVWANVVVIVHPRGPVHVIACDMRAAWQSRSPNPERQRKSLFSALNKRIITTPTFLGQLLNLRLAFLLLKRDVM